ncbi:MAG: helix-turn-helix transcriptional regulator [Ruminococcaceae bacterium]|nr:helix-turn-helix transcriptional regulator [Oscillospiraceae bacterium]
MEIRYYKLNKLLKERKTSLNKLQKELGLLQSEIEKIATNRLLLSDTYLMICQYLNCDIGDIMDIISLDDEKESFVDLNLITKNSYKPKLKFN